MSFQARPGCPVHLRAIVERHVNTLPAAWRQRPVSGEVFESFKQCFDRLQAWAFQEGFEVVTRGAGNGRTPSRRFNCVHHGVNSRNYHNLEARVERNEEGTITSNRQREKYTIKKMDCPWYAFCSEKGLPGAKELVLTIRHEQHSHVCADCPLVYPTHKHSVDSYQIAIGQAKVLREAIIPYAAARRILDNQDLGLSISKKEYYNSLCYKQVNPKASGTIEALVAALSEEGFICALRVVEEQDQEGHIYNKQVVQIWFTHPDLVRYAQRFVASKVMLIDGTWNTNKGKFPLIISSGIANCNQTFPVSFSWSKSECGDAFSFINSCHTEHCFNDNIVQPRVIAGDQAAGLEQAVKQIPGCSYVICSWHAEQAMKRKFMRAGRYTGDYVQNTLHGLIWDYLKSPTIVKLEENREALIDALHPDDHNYILDTWKNKEYAVIACYVDLLPTLGVRATSRSEGFHRVATETLNGQLPLQTAAKRLCRKIQALVNDLHEAEGIDSPRISIHADPKLFRALFRATTSFAVDKILQEWEDLKLLASQSTDIQLTIGTTPCQCPLLLQYGLPCRHYLLRCFQEGRSIPSSLLHPRWHAFGEPIRNSAWEPRYPDEWLVNESSESSEQTSTALIIALHQDRQRASLTHQAQSIWALRDTLSLDEQAKFDQRAREALDSLQQGATEAVRSSTVYLRSPSPVRQSRHLRKDHKRGRKRALTSTEIAERELKKRERNTRKTQRQARVLEQPQEQEEEENHTLPPPSTAPAQLEGSSRRSTRTRGAPLDYRALHTGQISPKKDI